MAARSTNLICIFTTSILSSSFLEHQPANAGGMARDDRVRRNIASHQRSRTDHRALADRDAAHNDCAAADRCAFANAGLFELPVALGLRRAIFIDGAWAPIVDEDHT